VVILQNDIGNQHSPMTIVSPLTSAQKEIYLPTHVFIKVDNVFDLQARMCDSVLLLEQIFTVNVYELGKYVGWIDLEDERIKRALTTSLGLANGSKSMDNEPRLNQPKG